ncbi:MAG: glycosyltransferase family A protein [Acidimicrobiales bacterium]
MSATPPAHSVSAIIPTYNSARYLAETLEAILAQTIPPLEVLVVDDGSTDDSVEVALGYSPTVTVLPGEHAGTAATRQRGLEASTCELVAGCDADDLWAPTKLERQIDALVADPGLDAVGCLADEFLSPDVDESYIPGRGLHQRVRSLAASSLLIRRRFVTSMGGFDTAFGLGESIDWFAKALRAGIRTDIVDEVLMRRRIHAHNTSRSFDTDKQAYLDILRRHLKDGRGTGT